MELHRYLKHDRFGSLNFYFSDYKSDCAEGRDADSSLNGLNSSRMHWLTSGRNELMAVGKFNFCYEKRLRTCFLYNPAGRGLFASVKCCTSQFCRIPEKLQSALIYFSADSGETESQQSLCNKIPEDFKRKGID